MCTRFYLEPGTREIEDVIEVAQRSSLADKFSRAGAEMLTSGEIYPTNVVPVIASDKSGRKSAFPMKWGFQIPGRSLIVNARVETAAQKPSFREAWIRHRCIIPASWYFVWEHLLGEKRKLKYRIQPLHESITWLAGLYRIENGFPVFTVVTREPAETIRHIHDRMPLIFPKEMIDSWIMPETDPVELLGHCVTGMTAQKAE